MIYLHYLLAGKPAFEVVIKRINNMNYLQPGLGQELFAAPCRLSKKVFVSSRRDFIRLDNVPLSLLLEGMALSKWVFLHGSMRRLSSFLSNL